MQSIQRLVSLSCLILFAVTSHGQFSDPPRPLTGVDHLNADDDKNVQIATDGEGVWIAVWETRESVSPVRRSGPNVLFSRSLDHGATWSDPALLSGFALENPGLDSNPTIVSAGDGRWMAAWTSGETLGGTLGSDTEIFYAHSSNNGLSWGAPMALNNNAPTDRGRDDNATIAHDGAGNWMVVWQTWFNTPESFGQDNEVLYARSTDGVTWSDPEAPYPHARTDNSPEGNPHLATDGGGVWIMAWDSRNTTDGQATLAQNIHFARSIDHGATWSAPRGLSNTAEVTNQDPHLATDGAGTWVAVWTAPSDPTGAEGYDQDIVFSRSTDSGLNWSPPAKLHANASDDIGTDTHAQVVSHGDGLWGAVWDSRANIGGSGANDYDVMFVYSVNDGVSWSLPSPLSTTALTDAGDDFRPSLATDRKGLWMAAWETRDDGIATGAGDDILLLTFAIDTSAEPGEGEGEGEGEGPSASALARILLNGFSAADTNNDGVVSTAEARAFDGRITDSVFREISGGSGNPVSRAQLDAFVNPGGNPPSGCTLSKSSLGGILGELFTLGAAVLTLLASAIWHRPFKR